MIKFLIRISFLVAVGVGAIFMSKQRPNGDFVKEIINNVSGQTQILTTRGKDISEHVNNILETYIKPATNSSSSSQKNKPIYEETLDYGRYLYCQQVVKDYEAQH